MEETKLRIEENGSKHSKSREFDLNVDDLESGGYESPDNNNNDQWRNDS